jgi:hypothetical protein
MEPAGLPPPARTLEERRGLGLGDFLVPNVTHCGEIPSVLPKRVRELDRIPVRALVRQRIGRLSRACLFSAALALPLAAGSVAAQELEPRALQNLPIGVSFAVLASGYSRGNLLFDPTVPIEDAQADVWSVAVGFMRAINVFGLSGRIGAVVPFVTGQWAGTVAGIDTATSRTGMADPRITLAVNFLGAPALTLAEMRGYRQTTVAGLQFTVVLPIGQYYPERLINLGTNRWGFASRLGISHSIGRRWVVEAYAGATFFTANSDFYGGTRFTQDPFLEAQAHAVYAIRYPDIWVAASVGYGWGAASTVDSVPKDPLQNVRASAMVRLPIARQHALKLVYITGITTKLGADFDTFQVAYTYTFGGKR